MTDFFVTHGAWSAGWAWRKMRPLIRAAGHELWTPTMTGLGERAHLAHPGIDLEHHIRDAVAVIETEDLRDLVLIGHSYGGMVATGVADRARERVARLIYLDAFAPDDGESLMDLAAPERRASFENKVAEEGDGWRLPPNPMPPDTPEADRAWAAPRRIPQPAETFRQKLTLTGGALTLPIDYIYCTIAGPEDGFRRFADKARTRGWPLHELAASHNPHLTMPEALTALLLQITAGDGGRR
ncbi:MAG: alpha/beta fold hydrolase [Alphaproteobacteria bacterium]